MPPNKFFGVVNVGMTEIEEEKGRKNVLLNTLTCWKLKYKYNHVTLKFENIEK